MTLSLATSRSCARSWKLGVRPGPYKPHGPRGGEEWSLYRTGTGQATLTDIYFWNPRKKPTFSFSILKFWIAISPIQTDIPDGAKIFSFIAQRKRVYDWTSFGQTFVHLWWTGRFLEEPGWHPQLSITDTECFWRIAINSLRKTGGIYSWLGQ